MPVCVAVYACMRAQRGHADTYACMRLKARRPSTCIGCMRLPGRSEDEAYMSMYLPKYIYLPKYMYLPKYV